MCSFFLQFSELLQNISFVNFTSQCGFLCTSSDLDSEGDCYRANSALRDLTNSELIQLLIDFSIEQFALFHKRFIQIFAFLVM